MKKIISLILCAVLVLSLGMVSFADETGVGESLQDAALEKTGIIITSVQVAGDYDVTVNYKSDSIDADTQVAILVYMQDDFDKPMEGNIVYIDQFDNSTGTYTFPMYSTAAEGTYNVVIGATGVDEAGAAKFTIGETKPEIYGDVDGNGKVRALDAALIAQHLAGTRTLTAVQSLAADVDANGTLTALDASLIKQFVVGNVAELPYVQEAVVATYDE